jgi:hypothetical protein
MTEVLRVLLLSAKGPDHEALRMDGLAKLVHDLLLSHVDQLLPAVAIEGDCISVETQPRGENGSTLHLAPFGRL